MASSNKNLKIFSVVVVVLLVIAIGYIALTKYTAWNQANRIGIAQYGYSQAILTIAKQAATCKPVPLMVGNQTINLIAVECKAAPSQETAQSTTE